MTEFIFYILGVLTGVCLASVFIFAGRSFRREVENVFFAIEKKLPSKKAEFLPVGDTEIDALEEVIKENEARGKDTELRDL